MVKKVKKKKSTAARSAPTPDATNVASTPARSSRRGLSNPRPRKEDDFDFNANSRQSNRVPRDDRTIKRDAASIELVRPAWNGKSGTVFRPLPCFDVQIEDEDVFMHARRSAKEHAMSDWIRGYPAVKYIGIETKFTFILYDPRHEQNGTYDPNGNPYIILHRAILDANDEGEAMIGEKNVMSNKWGPLTNDRSKKKAFNNRTWLYFIQGLVYQHNGEVLVKGGKPRGLRSRDLPQIIEISKTGAADLLELLNERVDEQFDPGDLAQYKVSNPVSLTDGFFITFYNPDNHTIGETAAKPVDSADVEEEDFTEEKDDGGSKKSSREFKGWKAHISDEFLYVRDDKMRKAKRDLTALEEGIRENILWWENIIHVPSHDEIAMMCAAAFRTMPALLHFGWQEHPEFFTDEVQGILAARTQGPGAEVPSVEDDEDDEVVGSARGNRSSALPASEDDEEYEDVVVSDEAAAAVADARASRRAGATGSSNSGARKQKKKMVKKKRKSTTSAASVGARKKVPPKNKRART